MVTEEKRDINNHSRFCKCHISILAIGIPGDLGLPGRKGDPGPPGSATAGMLLYNYIVLGTETSNVIHDCCCCIITLLLANNIIESIATVALYL